MIFRNTAAQTAAYLSGYVFGFIIAPIMIARLGLGQFGVWAVTGAFATYAGLMDLGVTRSVERFVALYHASEDEHRVAQCLGLGLIVATCVGVLAALAAILLAGPLASGLDGAITTEDLRAVMLCSVAIFLCNGYRFVINAVPIGMQRMIPPSIATIAYNVVSFALSLGALIASTELLTYALANVAAAVVGAAAALVALRRAWPAARSRRPSRPLVGDVLGYGLKAQVSWIADLVNVQADKVIIALVIDVRAAGAYEIANRAVSAVRTVAMMSQSALLAAATTKLAREGMAVMRQFYRHYALRAMSVALPLMIMTSVMSPALLAFWLGDIPDDAVMIFIGLTLANVANISTGVATNIWLGEGNAGILAVFATVSAAVNIALTLVLTPLFGLWGVVGATIVTIVGMSVVAMARFHRTHPIPVRDSVRAVGVPVALAAVASLPTLLWLALAGAPDDGRLEGMIGSAAFGASFIAIYWPAATRLGILPDKLALGLPRRRASATPVGSGT